MKRPSLKSKSLGALRVQRASAAYDANNFKLPEDRRAFCRKVRDEIDAEIAKRAAKAATCP